MQVYIVTLFWHKRYDQPIFWRLRTPVLIHVFFLASKIKLPEPRFDILLLLHILNTIDSKSCFTPRSTTCRTEPPAQSGGQCGTMSLPGCAPRSPGEVSGNGNLKNMNWKRPCFWGVMQCWVKVNSQSSFAVRQNRQRQRWCSQEQHRQIGSYEQTRSPDLERSVSRWLPINPHCGFFHFQTVGPCGKVFRRCQRRDCLLRQTHIGQPLKALALADHNDGGDGDGGGDPHLPCHWCQIPQGWVHIRNSCHWRHTNHQPHLVTKSHMIIDHLPFGSSTAASSSSPRRRWFPCCDPHISIALAC